MMKLSKEIPCNCGREHKTEIYDVISCRGAIERLPEVLRSLGCKRPFVLSDNNTFSAAGAKVENILTKSNIFSTYAFFGDSPAPDERGVGYATMQFASANRDSELDSVIAVGSGVIGDICKIIAATAKIPLITVATAPSMDGYASATSSMERNGLKVSINSKCADVIIGDHDILAAAPLELRLSGLGDMIAKYISIAEWRISNIINGEYYCERIAEMIRSALRDCIDHADGLVNGDPEAAGAVFDGLVMAGAGMAYAGCSRPASGVEHYFSHVWDMRALEFGAPCSTHGLQCCVGTVLAARVYDMLRDLSPSREKAIAELQKFKYDEYKNQLRKLIGKGSREMIILEEKFEHKYNTDSCVSRLDRIIEKWDDILEVINTEIPRESEIIALLNRIGAPIRTKDIGIPDGNIGEVFEATRDIRKKYVLSHLIFDLGLTKEAKNLLTAKEQMEQ